MDFVVEDKAGDPSLSLAYTAPQYEAIQTSVATRKNLDTTADILSIFRNTAQAVSLTKEQKSIKEFQDLMGWESELLAKPGSAQKHEQPIRGNWTVMEFKSASPQIIRTTGAVEKEYSLAHLNHSEKKKHKLRQEEASKTTGPAWFGMKAEELTDEKKLDLKILQMRSVLDPKRFYKKNDLKTLPKFFQIGTVISSPLEYHQSKTIKKKKTIVDELIADAQFWSSNKKRYNAIMAEKQLTMRKRGFKGKKDAKKFKTKHKATSKDMKKK